MVGTRAHPSTSSPCLSELPDSRGSKRKLDRPLADEGQTCEGAEPSTCAPAVQPEAGPPSAAELRAAQAARARLYGARPEVTQVSSAITPVSWSFVLPGSRQSPVLLDHYPTIHLLSVSTLAEGSLYTGSRLLSKSVCQTGQHPLPQTLTVHPALRWTPAATLELLCRCSASPLACTAAPVSTRWPMPVCRTDCWDVQECLAKAASKEWYEACGGLLGLRRLMVHHPEVLQTHL